MTTRDRLVGREVHQRMWDARITQTKIAPRLGLTQSALSKKLRGDRPWTLDELYQAASVLGCSVSDLLPPENSEPDSGKVVAASGARSSTDRASDYGSVVRHLPRTNLRKVAS